MAYLTTISVTGLQFLKQSKRRHSVKPYLSRRSLVTQQFVQVKIAKGVLTEAQGHQLIKSGRIGEVIPGFDARNDEDGYLLPVKTRSLENNNMCVSATYACLFVTRAHWFDWKSAIRTRYLEMEGQPWSSLMVDLEVVARLLDAYQGEVFHGFQADFDGNLGSPWNVFIRTIFTLDWLAHLQSGTLLCLPEELPLAAQADYAYVRQRFSNYIKNCIDQKAKKDKMISLDDSSYHLVSERRTSRRHAVSEVDKLRRCEMLTRIVEVSTEVWCTQQGRQSSGSLR